MSSSQIVFSCTWHISALIAPYVFELQSSIFARHVANIEYWDSCRWKFANFEQYSSDRDRINGAANDKQRGVWCLIQTASSQVRQVNFE